MMDKFNDSDIHISSVFNEINIDQLKKQRHRYNKDIFTQLLVCAVFLFLGILLLVKDFENPLAWFLGDRIEATYIGDMFVASNNDNTYSLRFLTDSNNEVLINASISSLKKIIGQSSSKEKATIIKYDSKYFLNELSFGFWVLGLVFIVLSFLWIYLQVSILCTRRIVVQQLINMPSAFDVIQGDVIQTGFNYYATVLPLFFYRKLVLDNIAKKNYENVEKRIDGIENSGDVEWKERYEMGDESFTRILYKYIVDNKVYTGFSPLINTEFISKLFCSQQKNPPPKVWIAVKKKDPQVNYFLGIQSYCIFNRQPITKLMK